jgi:uncharacterized repeat protein (TIGR01451 family)
MKPITITLLLACFLSSNIVSAQPQISIQWQRTIGTSANENFQVRYQQAQNLITQCSDGGYAVALLAPSNPLSTCDRGSWTGQRLWLIKFNKYGVTEWEKCFGGIYSNSMYISPGGLIQTRDGGFLLVGSTNFIDGDFSGNHGSYDGYVIKTSSTGVKEWSRCYGGSSAEGFGKVVEDNDGNYVLVGQAASNNGDVVGITWLGSFGQDAWIVKMDSTGKIIWQKCVDYMWGDESFSTLTMTSDGGYFAAGSLCARFSKSGSLLWQRNFAARSVVADSHNQFYCASASFGTPEIFKVSEQGNRLWTRNVFGGIAGPELITLQLQNDTTIMVSGKTGSKIHLLEGLHWSGTNYSNDDVFLAEMDTAAKIRYLQCFGGSEPDEPVFFCPATDNGYLILTRTMSSDGDVLQNFGGYDYWLLKVGMYNTIKGKMFYDYNNNAVQDAGEDDFKNVFVTSEKSGSVNGWYSTDGRFQYTVDTGMLVTKPLINQYYTTKPLVSSYTTYGHTDSVNFALVPVPGITDLGVSLSSRSLERPGFKNQFYLSVVNRGTQVVQSAVVGIVLDKKINIISHDSTDFFKVQDTLCWRLGNVEPGQSRTITINTLNPVPPKLNIEDSLFHFIIVRPFANDSSDYDNQDSVREIVYASWDPNNKLDDVGGIMYTDKYKSSDRLVYTINFQNTGTDTAFNVTVRDTISSLFDLHSFQMISGSHPYKLTLNGNQFQWTFENILLLDSLKHERYSHGYISFSIVPKAGLPLNEVFTNRASIYFDYNLPVMTNRDQVKLVYRPMVTPLFGSLLPDYCKKEGSIEGKVLNLPLSGKGVTVNVNLDDVPLNVTTAGTFNFDVSGLTTGAHKLSAKYCQPGDTTKTEWPFTVTAANNLKLVLSPNITTVVSLTQPVIISASNLYGGSNLLYTYALDRDFTRIIQAESSNNMVTIQPNTLSAGSNIIYGRINANGQCYTEPLDIDSVEIVMAVVTGIVDVDAPGQVIKVYPVPFTNQLFISGLVASKRYKLRLVNSQGNVVHSAIVANSSSYHFSTLHLPPGAYVIDFQKDQEKLGSVTIIKQ